MFFKTRLVWIGVAGLICGGPLGSRSEANPLPRCGDWLGFFAAPTPTFDELVAALEESETSVQRELEDATIPVVGATVAGVPLYLLVFLPLRHFHGAHGVWIDHSSNFLWMMALANGYRIFTSTSIRAIRHAGKVRAATLLGWALYHIRYEIVSAGWEARAADKWDVISGLLGLSVFFAADHYAGKWVRLRLLRDAGRRLSPREIVR